MYNLAQQGDSSMPTMAKKRLVKLALASAIWLALVISLFVALRSCGSVADFGVVGTHSRSIVTPSAPISTTGWVTNSVVISDITGLVTYTTDLYVTWTPVGAPDYYEVWRSDMPYFTPGDCVSCTLTATTDLTGTVVAAPHQEFNPCNGVAGCDLGSGLDFYIVRSRLPDGASGGTEIGVMSFSLDQGIIEPFP